METNKIDKLYRDNFNKRDNFKPIADYLIEKYTINVDDERKVHASADVAVGMAMGVAMAKNENLLKGLTIGVLGTSLAFGIYGKIKKRRNTEEEED